MHVRANQINPNAQLDAMYTAQKAAAKRETERTRKKLLEFASEVAGEAEGEDCAVKLGAREDSQEEAKHQLQDPPNRKKEDPGSEKTVSISDWA